MSRILYIGKDYCHTLEQLQQYFRIVTSAEDPLYQELLTLQLDGVIAAWLEEGSEKERELAKKVRSLPSTLTNRDLMEKLGQLMTNQSTLYDVNLLSYVELKEVAYALAEPSAFTQSLFCHKLKEVVYGLAEPSAIEINYEKVVKGDNIALGEKNLMEPLRLRLTFKILKPEKEVFRLKTTLSLRGEKVNETETLLRLDNEPVGKEIVQKINFPLLHVKKDAEDPYLLEIRDESQLLFALQVSPEGSGMFNVKGVKFKMIKVEGGNFNMGEGREAHEIKLNSFYIGEVVVTNELWRAVMGKNSKDGDAQLPVVDVSWNDCNYFIGKLNKITKRRFRLPTEAEWEFAARGGKKSEGYRYSGSNNIKEVAWYLGNSNSRTHPVKTKKKANELGIYDMSGNVWEWCHDWYNGNYYKVSPRNNPQGPSSGSRRVMRGGSWYYDAVNCRSSCRYSYSPGGSSGDIGFRLALSELRTSE